MYSEYGVEYVVVVVLLVRVNCIWSASHLSPWLHVLHYGVQYT